MHLHDTVMVGGKIRNRCKSFKEAEKLMAWCYKAGAENSLYGQFIADEYDRLYPNQPKVEIQWSELDLY